MSTASVPNSVQKVLVPGEVIIGMASTFYKDFYATDKRVLAFEKPAWLPVFILIGVLPYLLALLVAPKSFSGSVEYARVSGVNPRSSRRQFVAVALVLGLLLGSLGLFIIIIAVTSPYGDVEGVWVIGLFFAVLGLLLGIILGTRKANYWQIELADSPGQQPGKWRIPRQGHGSSVTPDMVVARLVQERARGKVA